MFFNAQAWILHPKYNVIWIAISVMTILDKQFVHCGNDDFSENHKKDFVENNASIKNLIVRVFH